MGQLQTVLEDPKRKRNLQTGQLQTVLEDPKRMRNLQTGQLQTVLEDPKRMRKSADRTVTDDNRDSTDSTNDTEGAITIDEHFSKVCSTCPSNTRIGIVVIIIKQRKRKCC